MKLNWSHVTQYRSVEMVQSMHQFFSKTNPTKSKKIHGLFNSNPVVKIKGNTGSPHLVRPHLVWSSL